MSVRSCKASINMSRPFELKLVCCLEMFLVSGTIVDHYPWTLNRYKTHETCKKIVLVEPYAIESVYDQYKTHELCNKAVER